jgi:hypothetical protein
MASSARRIHILRRNHEVLPEAAIRELKDSIGGEVIFRGGAAEKVYRAATDRKNKVWIQEAVTPHLPKILSDN